MIYINLCFSCTFVTENHCFSWKFHYFNFHTFFTLAGCQTIYCVSISFICTNYNTKFRTTYVLSSSRYPRTKIPKIYFNTRKCSYLILKCGCNYDKNYVTDRKIKVVIIFQADAGGRAAEGVDLQRLDCWDRVFEARWGHGFSSHMFVVCWVGSGLCDGLTTHSESPTLCVRACVSACNFV